MSVDMSNSFSCGFCHKVMTAKPPSYIRGFGQLTPCHAREVSHCIGRALPPAQLCATCCPCCFSCFSISSWPQSKENSSSGAMSVQMSVGNPGLPWASSLHGAQGEAGHAPGPVPNICCDTQIIFIGCWQVLTSLWLVQYLSVQ